MKDIFCVDFRDSIRHVVRKEMKEKYGIKVPKIKNKDKHRANERLQKRGKIFGALLEDVPSKNIKDDQYFAVPMFLMDAFNYLNNHMSVEGLFRKSGSSGRQRVLREIIERDGSFTNCDFLHPHDVASLVKQYFRELPDPLLTTHLSSVFLRCMTLQQNNDSLSALLLCTLLLPDEHLRVLKYLSKYITGVSNHSMETKMTLKNLSIVFAPNLMGTAGKDRNSEKAMRETTKVVDLLFKNSHMIGMVPDTLFEKASSIHLDGGCYSSSGDEVESGERRGRTMEIQDEKKHRSKSITDFLRKNFKSNDRNIGRQVSEDNEKDINGDDIPLDKWMKRESLHDLGIHLASNLEKQLKVTHTKSGKADKKIINEGNGPKRRRDSKTNSTSSPVKKSPRLGESDKQVPVISLPIMKTMPNQMALTPRSKFQSIHSKRDPKSNTPHVIKDVKLATDTPVFPSKFDLSRVRAQTFNSMSLPRSKINAKASHDSELDQNIEPKLPLSRISRATQKPHVKKCRRASSVDRRRARYQSGTPVGQRILPKTPLKETQAVSRFQEENLTVNIAFIANDTIPMDVDTTYGSDISRSSIFLGPPSCDLDAKLLGKTSSFSRRKMPTRSTFSRKESKRNSSSNLETKISRNDLKKSNGSRKQVKKSMSFADSRNVMKDDSRQPKIQSLNRMASTTLRKNHP